MELIPRCGGRGAGSHTTLRAPLSRFDAALKFLLRKRCSQINEEAAPAPAVVMVVVVGRIIWFLLPQIIDPEVRLALTGSTGCGRRLACRLPAVCFQFFPDPD